VSLVSEGLERNSMRTFRPRVGPALATFLFLFGASLASSAHAAINAFVTINGSCGVEVQVGQRICITYGYNPTGQTPPTATGRLTVQKGNNAPVTVFNGPVFGAEPNDLCDVVGTGPANRILRLTVTTAAGEQQSVTCTYSVRSSGQTAPVITTALRVNTNAANCGAVVQSGDRVCLRLSSSQSGFAEVTLQKEGGTEQRIARGSVTAGVRYAVCVTAGAADGKTRTFRVRVTTGSGASSTESCVYVVRSGK
jgi:hypothetical protein